MCAGIFMNDGSIVNVYDPGCLPEDVERAWNEMTTLRFPVSNPICGPKWFQMMAEQNSGGASVVVVRAGDRNIVAVWPVLFRDWVFDLRVVGASVVARRVPAAVVFNGGAVAGSLPDEVLSASVAAIGELRTNCDVVVWERLSDPAMMSGLAEAALPGFAVRRTTGTLPHYRLVTTGGEETGWTHRSRKTVEKIDRRERALARAAGEVRVVEIRKKHDWEPYIDGINNLMHKTWQSERLGHGFDTGQFVSLERRGWLRSFLLLAGNIPAAFVFGYQCDGYYVYAQVGYEREYGRFSPGTILLYRMLSLLTKNDPPRCVDFGEGDAQYKREVSNHVVRVGTVVLVKRRPWLRLWTGAFAACAVVSGTLTAAVRRLRRGRPA